MKKPYMCYPEFNDNDELLWFVYEKATEQIVANFWFEEDAEEFVQFLSNGGGFAGFTPNFMLTKISNSDINDAFLAKFSE